MKSLRSIKTSLGLIGLLCALYGATVARADLSYLIDINTAPIVGNAAGAFYLDFQSYFGSGSAQTVTLSNFTFTGGSLLAGTDTTTGAVSGNLATSLVLNPNSGSFNNEFYQQFGSTVSDIKFTATLTTNAATGTPTSFVVAVLDNATNNIPTTGLGNSLLYFNLDGSSTNYQIATSTGDTGGVTISLTAIPEPSTYAAMAGGLSLFAAIIARRRRAAVGV